MKWIFVSGMLHLSLLGALSFGMKQSFIWQKNSPVYYVELVEQIQETQPDDTGIEVIEEKIEHHEKDAEMIVKKEPLPKPVESLNKKTTAKENDTRADANQESGPKLSVQGDVFPHQFYLATLKKRIEENWQPPFQEVDASDKLSAIVRFRIQRSGEVDQIRLEQATNRFLFDQAAQRAIFNLGRMPPLPPEFTGGHIIVHVEFETTW